METSWASSISYALTFASVIDIYYIFCCSFLSVPVKKTIVKEEPRFNVRTVWNANESKSTLELDQSFLYIRFQV
jgi:hypothetical protein